MDQEKLSVSIVVPVYNVSLYIERCVRSVMAQTYPVLECIIVDDASPDDSIARAERLISDYDGSIRFVILHHDHNRGLSAARNTGTEAAKGDYIFYLDSDDELTPDCIEKLARPIERDPSIEMVQGNHKVYSDVPRVGRIIYEEDLTSSEAVRAFFFDRAILPVNAWNKMMLKKFLTVNGLRFKDGILYEDCPWAFYVMKNLRHLYVIPDITYQYYVRPLSICTGTSESEKARYHGIVFEDIAKHFTPGEEAREARYYLEPYYFFFIRNRRVASFKRALPLFESALASGEYRKERLRLLVLRLLSESAVINWILAILVPIRRVILRPFRRMALLWRID